MRPDRSAFLRATAVAVALVACAGATLVLARVDTPLGAPAGPERLLDGSHVASAPDARAALQSRPVDGTALRVVALQTGDRARRRALLQRALVRWPRDRIGRAHLMADAFAEGRYDEGVAHLDALLRVAPHAAPDVLRVLLTDLRNPEVRESFARRLREAPPWRSAVVPVLTESQTDPSVALSTLDALARHSTLGPAEVLARAATLERLGRADEARAAWWASIARGAAPPLFDPRFRAMSTPGPYAWRIGDVPGVDVESVPDGGLRLDFDGRAVRFAHLEQTLALAAGQYRLHASAANAVDTERPFVWRLQCHDGAVLAQLELPRAGEGRVDTAFEVPNGCPRQAIRLVHMARSTSEAELRGELLLHDIGIVPTR